MPVAPQPFYSMGATRFSIGTSTIFRLVPTDFVNDWQLRILVGGGTLEIVNSQFSGSSTAASNGWGTGYAVGMSEVIRPYGPATVYLAVTAATMTVGLALYYANGASIL